jgi:hypothetical protein
MRSPKKKAVSGRCLKELGYWATRQGDRSRHPASACFAQDVVLSA